MGNRKTKKASSKILKEILEKYELHEGGEEEMKELLFEFVQCMTTKEIKVLLKDYNIQI